MSNNPECQLKLCVATEPSERGNCACPSLTAVMKEWRRNGITKTQVVRKMHMDTDLRVCAACRKNAHGMQVLRANLARRFEQQIREHSKAQGAKCEIVENSVFVSWQPAPLVALPPAPPEGAEMEITLVDDKRGA